MDTQNLTVVNNSTTDVDAPVLLSFTVSPTSVDISSGAVSITASIRASDTSEELSVGYACTSRRSQGH